MKRNHAVAAVAFVCLLLQCYGQTKKPGPASNPLPNTQIHYFPGSPTGPCNTTDIATNAASGDLYDCQNGAWKDISIGSSLTPIVAPSYGTATNCSAAGSSVAASAVACGSAAAGLFSIPITTPTSAVVTTTALTPHSEIFVQQRLDTANGAGAALTVTCNTATNATVPNITARTATSFTITFAAFSTNPGCYEYHIIN